MDENSVEIHDDLDFLETQGWTFRLKGKLSVDDQNLDNLDKHGRAFAGCDKTYTMFEGQIIAYSVKPMYLIKTADGEKHWWREDLVETSEIPDILKGTGFTKVIPVHDLCGHPHEGDCPVEWGD